MHAQATSDSQHVSKVEDVAAPRKSRSKSLYPDTDHPSHTSALPSFKTARRRCSTTVASTTIYKCDASSPATTTVTNYSSDVSRDSLSTPKTSGTWSSKAFSKGNNNSRNSLTTSKSKGVCCGRRRLIDEEGYIRRAACICVNKEETEVLLVTSKKDPCAWLVPGGGLEIGEEAVAAAHREAWEEAGIQGVVERFLGLFESCHHSGSKKHRTAVFVFVVTKEHKDFPEARLGRRRRWFPLEDALLLLARHRPLQSAYLQLLMMSKLKMAAAS